MGLWKGSQAELENYMNRLSNPPESKYYPEWISGSSGGSSTPDSASDKTSLTSDFPEELKELKNAHLAELNNFKLKAQDKQDLAEYLATEGINPKDIHFENLRKANVFKPGSTDLLSVKISDDEILVMDSHIDEFCELKYKESLDNYGLSFYANQFMDDELETLAVENLSYKAKEKVIAMIEDHARDEFRNDEDLQEKWDEDEGAFLESKLKEYEHPGEYLASFYRGQELVKKIEELGGFDNWALAERFHHKGQYGQFGGGSYCFFEKKDYVGDWVLLKG